jgi:thiol-disulfide isomerase/thioredoxin
MGKRILFIIVLICITFTLKAEGYRISIQWEGLKDTSVYLAHYFDTKIYVDDTTKLDKNGKSIFKGEKKLHEGLYVLYLNEKVYFDILIGADQEFKVITNNDDVNKNLKIENSTESENFWAYQNMLKEKGTEKSELAKQYQQAESAEKQIIQDKINVLDDFVKKYISTESNKYPGTMYSLFLKTSSQVTAPELNIKKDNPQYDSISWFHYYNFNRDHYFDSVDFADDRILYTPLLTPKLDIYFNKILIQTPDSITPQAFKIIDRARKNKLVFQYIAQYLLNNSLQSKIMGMDGVFLSIADGVYLNGDATWADSTTLAKIAEEAYLTRPNLIGKKAPELIMENIEGEYESLQQLQSKYTVLVFWEPSCGHCKKEIPDLYQNVYLKYLNQNIDYFAVNIDYFPENTGDKKKKWKEWSDFVNEHQLVGWHHVWDPSDQSRFRYKYNIKTTPILYLLDKDKKIIAKRIDNTTLIKLLDTLLKK